MSQRLRRRFSGMWSVSDGNARNVGRDAETWPKPASILYWTAIRYVDIYGLDSVNHCCECITNCSQSLTLSCFARLRKGPQHTLNFTWRFESSDCKLNFVLFYLFGKLDSSRGYDACMKIVIAFSVKTHKKSFLCTELVSSSNLFTAIPIVCSIGANIFEFRPEN